MPSQQQLLDVINIQAEIAKLGLDLGGVMAMIVERIPALIGADGAALELAEGTEMIYQAAAGMATHQVGLRLNRDTSLSGLCVETGETLVCNDSETDPRVDLEACRRVNLRSMIVMPLTHQSKVVGVLKAMSRQVGKFSQDDMNLLGLLSELIAAAMYFATTYDNKDLFHRATHDALTNLPNRALFMDRLRTAIAHNERDRRGTAVLMIDMDGLKQINDTFGHRTGDAVLCEFASRVSRIARHSDTVARLGGDEFAAILTPIMPNGIDAAIQRLMQEIEAPFLFDSRVYKLRASIGAAFYPDDSNDIIHLIDMADQRMYAMKREHHAMAAH
ncbi:MAG TPA: sensor domain-containing diguanylate cyclase [Candidatus Sulfotelmatobacter sp.]|jgi:diguanylate cyclase (GGDEF)-like protein|nr:sensor domain-containing diguanylate cyclase [Candidatus Sulfotelmatobacter sp.]